MTFDPSLHECIACNAKPGSPHLCDACYRNRTAAGSRWIGLRPPEAPLVDLIDCCCAKTPCVCWYGLQKRERDKAKKR